MQFVINYEEGGENCLLHGDTASEKFLSEIIGAEAIRDARRIDIARHWQQHHHLYSWK